MTTELPEKKRGFIFADEAGCFTFARNGTASRYFIVCTLTIADCSDLSNHMLALRRELIWARRPVGDYFHATTDKQEVRDAVFDVLRQHQFFVRATILEKSKAKPKIRSTEEQFYQYGWFFHLRNSLGPQLAADRELQITAASLGTHKKRGNFEAAVNNVLQQTLPAGNWVTAFCPAQADPCLQAVDYCTWAIQRKWERGDTRSYDLIKDRIRDEFDLFAPGQIHHY